MPDPSLVLVPPGRAFASTWHFPLYLWPEYLKKKNYCIRSTVSFSRTTWVNWLQKGKPFWILVEQEMMGWQWHQLDHVQIICTSLQTDNHASTCFYRPDALPDDQPTASKHWSSKKKKRLQMYYLVQWWRKGLLQIGQHLLKQEGLRKHLFVFIKGNKLLFFFARWNNSWWKGS